MTSRSHIRRVLGHFLLVLMLVVHAPVAGVMAAQPDHAHGHGLVICLDGGFAEIDGPVAPLSEGAGVHECLCPCATLAGETFLTGGSSLAAELLEPDLRHNHGPQR